LPNDRELQKAGDVLQETTRRGVFGVRIEMEWLYVQNQEAGLKAGVSDPGEIR